MRGAVYREPNQPLTIEEFHIPRPKVNEILIKTKACGVCHSDLHVMKGEIPFSSPCVIGHEITGEVVEHGPLTDHKIIQRFPIGSRVVGAFIMPCGTCSYCAKDHDDLCEDFFVYNRAKGTLYDGETRLFLRHDDKKDSPVYMYSMGGMVEYHVTPAHGFAPLPESLPYTESAILARLCCFYSVCCLQIARAFGASDIIAVDVQDDKLEKAKTLGATSWLEPRLSLKEPIVINKFICLSSPKTEMVFSQLPSRDQEIASLVIMLQQLQRRRHKEISSLLITWIMVL
ncbi:hypothetical protein Bca52824_081685 [Brassica carinata]|uniref:Uncharacterized protein n=1 Tax=Brassica carinata TaxID=52824 RepID=A0A8X7TRV1_BRACI|nr:hypothetical protein Bca52824_081685 [Brassica carinata]